MSSTILARGGDDERVAFVPSPTRFVVGEGDTTDVLPEARGPDAVPVLSSAGRGGTNDIESHPGDTPAIPIASTSKVQ
jgi:hypothetical protein